MKLDRDRSEAKTPLERRRALVVEGGAMRGIFAAGVLDRFIERQHFGFDGCFGVSAGSTALAAYLSGQRGRTRRIKDSALLRQGYTMGTRAADCYLKGLS